MQDRRAHAILRCVALVMSLQLWCVGVHWVNNRKATRIETVLEVDRAPTADNQVDDWKTRSAQRRRQQPERSSLACVARSAQHIHGSLHGSPKVYRRVSETIGALGTLDAWASRLAALQRTLQPNAVSACCIIFAGDHGVASGHGGESCSAYPQAVTWSILMGLRDGVAGACVLAKANNVALRGVVEGDDDPIDDDCAKSQVVASAPDKLPRGTRNFCVEPAVTTEECKRSIGIGRRYLVHYIQETGSTIVVLGEIGIGNTTSSSALIAPVADKMARDDQVAALCGDCNQGAIHVFGDQESWYCPNSLETALWRKTTVKEGYDFCRWHRCID